MLDAGVEQVVGLHAASARARIAQVREVLARDAHDLERALGLVDGDHQHARVLGAAAACSSSRRDASP